MKTDFYCNTKINATRIAFYALENAAILIGDCGFERTVFPGRPLYASLPIGSRLLVKYLKPGQGFEEDLLEVNSAEVYL